MVVIIECIEERILAFLSVIPMTIVMIGGYDQKGWFWTFGEIFGEKGTHF